MKRPALPMLAAAAVAFALFLVVHGAADAQGITPPSLGGPPGPPGPPGAPPAGGPAGPPRGAPLAPVMPPTILEIGQNRDGTVTYVASGYAPSSAGSTSLGGMAYGEFTFRVGGFCLDSAFAALATSGLSANTTAWSYDLTAVNAAFVEDAPNGSCKYTVRVNYAVSATGAISLNQIQYTVYLKGHPPAGGSGGALTVIK